MELSDSRRSGCVKHYSSLSDTIVLMSHQEGTKAMGEGFLYKTDKDNGETEI